MAPPQSSKTPPKPEPAPVKQQRQTQPQQQRHHARTPPVTTQQPRGVAREQKPPQVATSQVKYSDPTKSDKDKVEEHFMMSGWWK